MATRTITATLTKTGTSGSNKDPNYMAWGTGRSGYTITYDSGYVSAAVVTSATLTLTSFRRGESAGPMSLNIYFGESSYTVVGTTNTVDENGTLDHTFDLTYLTNTLATDSIWDGQIIIQPAGSSTLNIRSTSSTITLVVTYSEPSLEPPGVPTITQNVSDGKCNISWNAATINNGSGTIYYTVFGIDFYDNVVVLADDITTTSISNIRLSNYGTYNVEVVASVMIGGTELMEISINSTYVYPPLLSQPTFQLDPESGDSTKLTWTNPTVYYGEATAYDYIICYYTTDATGIDYGSITGQTAGTITATVSSSWLETVVEDGDLIGFDITASAHIKEPIANSGYDIVSSTSDIQYFSYDGKRTIGYYNGSEWKECVVYYYNGTEWKECIPYYYNGTNWVELKFNE